MKFSPPVEEVKALTARGEYKVAPISCEILSDMPSWLTPVVTVPYGTISAIMAFGSTLSTATAI